MRSAPDLSATKLEVLDSEYARRFLRHEMNAFAFKKGEDEWIAIDRLMFHATMRVGSVGDEYGHNMRYCYADIPLALAAATEWAERDFEGEPKWWHRNPETERRREGGDPEKETIVW
jgi:hypothetical protein